MEDKRIIELYFARNESAIAETDKKYGSYHSQAKFIYDGDLYVIDVTSREDIHDIQEYLDRILKEE